MRIDKRAYANWVQSGSLAMTVLRTRSGTAPGGLMASEETEAAVAAAEQQWLALALAAAVAIAAAVCGTQVCGSDSLWK
jgi:hypothetical protein